jgi:hypothetical protein
MNQSTTSSSLAGIAVDFEESKAIDDVAAVIETPAEFRGTSLSVSRD